MLVLLTVLFACAPEAQVSEAPIPDAPAVAPGAVPAPPVVPAAELVDTSQAVTRSTAACKIASSCATDCDVGDPLACSQLGLWHQYGLAGVEQDAQRAAELQKRSCDLGAGAGCFNLAVQRTYGIGVLRDAALAEALLGRAAALHEASCEAGAIGWCINHAGMLLRGQGVEQDKHRAIAILREHCANSIGDACVSLAMALRKGDIGAAQKLLQKSCGNGEMVSCGHLGETYLDIQPPDPVAANVWFRSGCESNEPQACRNLGYQLITGQGAAADPPRGLELLEAACEASKAPDGGACHLAAVTLLTGANGIMPDPSRASLRLGQACMMGQGIACMQAAQLIASGKVPADRYSAEQLTEMACYMGNADACRIIEGTP